MSRAARLTVLALPLRCGLAAPPCWPPEWAGGEEGGEEEPDSCVCSFWGCSRLPLRAAGRPPGLGFSRNAPLPGEVATVLLVAATFSTVVCGVPLWRLNRKVDEAARAEGRSSGPR